MLYPLWVGLSFKGVKVKGKRRLFCRRNKHVASSLVPVVGGSWIDQATGTGSGSARLLYPQQDKSCHHKKDFDFPSRSGKCYGCEATASSPHDVGCVVSSPSCCCGAAGSEGLPLQPPEQPKDQGSSSCTGSSHCAARHSWCARPRRLRVPQL